MTTANYIISALLIFGILCGLIYIFSRIQMKAWTHGINKYFEDKYKNNLKTEKDERTEKI